LDIKAETIPLGVNEREIKKVYEDLAKLLRYEEPKWNQRAKVKHVKEGGNNIIYFHLIANGKHCKKESFN
jgi:hypothetical protein